jgi:signal transduction histidine kinase
MFKRLTTRLVFSQLLVIGIATALLTFVLLSLVQSYFVQAVQQSLLIQARLAAQVLPGSAKLAEDTGAVAPLANVQQSQLPSASNSVQSITGSLQIQNTAPLTPATNLAQNVLNNSGIRLSLDLDTRVRILNARGVVESDSAGTDRLSDLSSNPDVQAALNNQETISAQGDSVIAAVPLRRDGRIDGAVLLSQPLHDVSIVMADLRARLLLSATVALVLATLVGILLARSIARPVRELTSAANQLARGNFDYPLNVTSQDELGDLSRAFRTMSGDLHHMLQARTDLLANVSHELRTPLAAVKGLVETLRDGAADDPAVRDHFLAMIEQQTDRLTRLVSDLLILSRADSNALTLQRQPTDMTALAHTCIDQLTPQAANRQVTLCLNGAPIRVPIDPDRIEQVLLNLLDNAIRFSPPGGEVTVSITPLDSTVKVAVSDQGPGIPLAEQPRVFERFYRGDKSRARQDESSAGAGLGLSIAQALVRAHGGTMGLDSPPGHGVTVWFTLPL